MKFTLEIDLGNDGMRRPGHVAAALKDVAGLLTHRMSIGAFKNAEGRILDINGNTVGKWEVVD